MSGDRARRTVHFSGHVQGVGFRYTVARLARSFAVTGYVRNLPNGEVELVVEASSDVAEAFVGAVAARMEDYISNTRSDMSSATGEFGSFDIRF